MTASWHAAFGLYSLTKQAAQSSGPDFWSTVLPAWITAAATALLGIGAVFTAIYAVRAFGKQSQEVSDQQQLTKQQFELLKVQSAQLDLQKQQLDDQRRTNAKLADVLALQAQQLREGRWQQRRTTRPAPIAATFRSALYALLERIRARRRRRDELPAYQREET